MAKKEKKIKKESFYPDHWVVMSQSPIAKTGYKAGQGHPEFTPNLFQLMIASFFTAVIIMITRMHTYQRPMGQFYWNPGQADQMSNISDFFSYYKMTAIVICGTLAALVLLYHVFCQTLTIRKSIFYIPMGVYCVFAFLSYATSDYKYFALFGYNDRFEGTVVVLCYMLMLFYIINMMTSEKSVKWILYPIAVTSAILGMIGVSQAMDVDFFRTTIGKKLITPSSYWGHLDELDFTFQNREIYQTVYNINYVSFYLTLLVPIFAMLFIRENEIKKKILWGALFTLLFFNMIGAQSSGGIMGLAVMLVLALVVLNKRLWQWKKSVIIVLALMLAVSAGTFQRFAPELFGAVNSVLGKQVLTVPGSVPERNTIPGGPTQSNPEDQESQENQESQVNQENQENILTESAQAKTRIDYMETGANYVKISLNGEALILYMDNMADPNSGGIYLYDESETAIPFRQLEDGSGYVIDDPRFAMCNIQIAASEQGDQYILVNIDEMQWPFQITPEKFAYINGFGKQVDLIDVPHTGFENNQEFGSGRGYIWSRTLPMLKDALILGHGADTYCLYFPHRDYVGKYHSGTFSGNVNIIVDKPHNMYMGMIIGTGGISFLAFMALALIYIGQSIKLYLRLDFEDGFLPAAGVGIFLGICGFLVAGFVNDSSVSVMPLFYGLFGTGIAINHMIQKRASADLGSAKQ